MKRSFIKYLAVVIIVNSIIFTGNTQLIPGKMQAAESKEHIQSLKKGALIVPLFRQQKKWATIEKMLDSETLDNKTKAKMSSDMEKELEEMFQLNQALCLNFVEHYTYSKVYFIFDHQMKGFKPLETVYINPKTLQPDPEIVFDEGSYYFLNYFSNSGPATTPGDVRFFYLADADKQVLTSPFPFSPGRKHSFITRLKELFNVDPELKERIKLLTIKLNELLERYSNN